MADYRVLTLEFDDVTPVELKFEGGCDVIHCHDDYHDRVFEDTGVFQSFAQLVTSPAFKDNLIIEVLRDSGLLDDYNRGDFDFENYVSNVVRDNMWDFEFVNGTLEQYDYKRGFYRVKFGFPTTLGYLKQAVEAEPNTVAGLGVVVYTGVGTLTIE